MTSAADAKNSAIDLPIIIPKGDQKADVRARQGGTSLGRLLVSDVGTINKSCMLNTSLTRYRILHASFVQRQERGLCRGHASPGWVNWPSGR